MTIATIGHNQTPIDDFNPVYESGGVKFKLTEICHDIGMRAYFKWKAYNQERANEEYEIAYFTQLRKMMPNHPHLKHAPI